MPYNHAEAFCLMKYATKDGMEVEWIWNSRDGVTPFGISSRSGHAMYHVDWPLDRCLPHYLPLVGERVFVDLTPDLAQPHAVQFVNEIWDHPEFPMSCRYPDKPTAVEKLIEEWCQPGAPTVVVWGEYTSGNSLPRE